MPYMNKGLCNKNHMISFQVEKNIYNVSLKCYQ